MTNKYDEAIASLRKKWSECFDDFYRAQLIFDVWKTPKNNPEGCLFWYCNNLGDTVSGCGCLTQVKHNGFETQGNILLEEIRADNRIPESPINPGFGKSAFIKAKIILDNLEVFKEWQERLDEVYNREMS